MAKTKTTTAAPAATESANATEETSPAAEFTGGAPLAQDAVSKHLGNSFGGDAGADGGVDVSSQFDTFGALDHNEQRCAGDADDPLVGPALMKAPKTAPKNNWLRS